MLGRAAVHGSLNPAAVHVQEDRCAVGGCDTLRLDHWIDDRSETEAFMQTFVALLRGINVGGRSRLPMKDLVAILERLGVEHIRTCLQSGNVVFESRQRRMRLPEDLASAIQKEHGFKPHVLVLEPDAIVGAMISNPFPEAEQNPKNLHLGFLASVPEHPDLAKLESLKKPGERFCLIGPVLYLHAPDGVGRSRLAAASEKAMGVPMTDRNWETVRRIRELARR